MDEFHELINNIPGIKEANSDDEEISESEAAVKFKEYWAPRISEITDKYLGKGNKVNNCSREQVEALSLIIDDLKELVKGNN